MRFAVHILIKMEDYSHPFRDREPVIQSVHASKVSVEAAIPAGEEHIHTIQTHNVFGFTNRIAKGLIKDLSAFIEGRRMDKKPEGI